MEYCTRDNGGSPFLVKITETNDKDTVKIFKGQSSGYPTLVKTYENPFKIYIGRSTGETGACDHSPIRSSKFDGNSILLQMLHPDNKIVHIGREVYEFTTTDKDYINGFYSPLGRSCVPYPLAVGRKFVYLLLDKVYVPIEDFPKNTNWEDAYRYYYDHLSGAPMYNIGVIEPRQ